MTVEAFWSVSFQSNDGLQLAGFGVVVFDSGKIYGGDSNFYFRGNYTIEGKNDFKARVKVKRFAPGMPSVTGLDEYVLVVERVGRGDYNADQFMVEGYVEVAPQKKVYVGFSRIENLP